MADIRFTDVCESTLDAATRRDAAITLAELADGDREGLALALAMLGLP